MNGKEIKYIEQTLELYSKSSEIKAFIKEENNMNEIQIKDNINWNLLLKGLNNARLHNGFKKACRTQDTDAVRRKHNNSE